MLFRLWRNHSLSITLALIGGALNGYAATLEPGRWFDFILALGCGAWTVCLFYALAGPLRERNRPEA